MPSSAAITLPCAPLRKSKSSCGRSERKFPPILSASAIVAKRPRFEVRVTGPARQDIATILNWSRKEFGEAAALRYQVLIVQALQDIGDDLERPGSKEGPEIMIKGVPDLSP